MATFEGQFTDAADLKIAVVVARFNDLVSSKLLSGCLDCLSRHGIDTSEMSSQLDVAWVPGSFEIPIVSQQLAKSGRYQVIVTLGAVIRGDTPHFDVVVAEASKGVAAVARDTGVPVFPVLERPVPPSMVPGEEAWPTQPIPTRPPPLVRQATYEADLTNVTPEARAEALREFHKYKTGPLYTPPSLQGTITTPGHLGGAEWGGEGG